jgi:hypothetical protein
MLAEGFDVIGFDIERHDYGEGRRYPAQLVLQDVLTLHGSQFRDAALIVASPPCQEYSYMAMPWSRAKAIAAEYRSGARDVRKLTALFDACFRIQREAMEAAGRFIPLVVENVRGAQPWVGRSRWNFGSFHLWGDVPALMPMTVGATKVPGHSMSQGEPKWSMHHKECVAAAEHIKNNGGSWFAIANNTASGRGQNPDGRKLPGFRFDGSGRSFQTASVDGLKQPGISGPRMNGKGDAWFQDGAAIHGSKSPARKAASAAIAKIPFTLSRYIARVYSPDAQAVA